MGADEAAGKAVAEVSRPVPYFDPRRARDWPVVAAKRRYLSRLPKTRTGVLRAPVPRRRENRMFPPIGESDIHIDTG